MPKPTFNSSTQASPQDQEFEGETGNVSGSKEERKKRVAYRKNSKFFNGHDQDAGWEDKKGTNQYPGSPKTGTQENTL